MLQICKIFINKAKIDKTLPNLRCCALFYSYQFLNLIKNLLKLLKYCETKKVRLARTKKNDTQQDRSSSKTVPLMYKMSPLFIYLF